MMAEWWRQWLVGPWLMGPWLVGQWLMGQWLAGRWLVGRWFVGPWLVPLAMSFGCGVSPPAALGGVGAAGQGASGAGGSSEGDTSCDASRAIAACAVAPGAVTPGAVSPGAVSPGDLGAGDGAAHGATSGGPGDQLFAEGEPLRVELTLDPATLRELDEHGDREEWRPGSARLQRGSALAASFGRIGVRYKGDQSLHQCYDDHGGVRSYTGECRKLSWKLDFDRYAESARFDGLKQLNLHASMGDASRLRELVAYQTFREAGVDAPRALPAEVFVNGEARGLFIAVEEVDGRYTQGHYPAGPNGTLYKEVWPNPASSDAELALGLRTNEDRGDVSDMRALATAVGRASAGDFDAELAPFIEIEAWLRYIAVDRALINWDGIMAFYTPHSPHNFYLYHDDGPAPRFHLIPWDLDATFWPFDPYMHPEQWVTAPPIPDFNARPLDCAPRSIWQAGSSEVITPPRCDALLDGLARLHWARFAELGRELLLGPLSAERLAARVDGWQARVAALAARDPMLTASGWQRAVQELRASMSERAMRFGAFLSAGLIDESPVVPLEPPALDDPDLETTDDGLHAGALTNFEFGAAPADALPEGVYTYADPRAALAARWSTSDPLSGSADLRLDFTFNRGPEAYDEWAGVGISCAEADVRVYSAIVVWLVADAPRRVRVRLASPVYDDAFGGVPAELGQDVEVAREPRAVVLERSGFYYPSWAIEGLGPGQSFPIDLDDARDQVMARFSGLIFAPSPTLDAAGQLASASESGQLGIDNIYFVR